MNYMINFVTIILMFFTQICSSSEALGEKEFTALKDNIIYSSDVISRYGAKEAINEINSNIKLFDNIHEKVKSARHPDDVVNEVADGLQKLAISYKKISDMKSDIFGAHDKAIYNFKDVEGKTQKNIELMNIDIKSYSQKIEYLERQLPIEANDLEKQKIDVSLKGSKSIIKSLKAQVVIWSKFYEAQERLLSKLKLNSEKIKLLFFILETNAEVYKQAANVAMLRKSALAALDNLSSLSDVQDIVMQMTANWTEVSNLVQELSSSDFKF